MLLSCNIDIRMLYLYMNPVNMPYCRPIVPQGSFERLCGARLCCLYITNITKGEKFEMKKYEAPVVEVEIFTVGDVMDLYMDCDNELPLV